MRNHQMKQRLIILVFGIAIAWNCNQFGTESNDSEREILMEGMDIVSMGGNLKVVVNSQEDYDKLIYNRYTKPLQDYWNANYESILQSVKNKYPNRSDQEYAELVKAEFYKLFPFKGTENYTHPTIDFSKYTLLGQNVSAGGCSLPNYKISILRDDKLYTFLYKVNVLQHGTCEKLWAKNMWMLVRKIPNFYTVKFESEFKTD